MSGAHLHLSVNDVPILAALTAGVLFAIALVARSRDVWTLAGLIALAVATAGGLVAFLSGIGANDSIAGMPRTSNKALSEHHVRAIVASVATGIAASVGLVAFLRVRRRRKGFSRGWLVAILVPTLVAAASLAWTGLAGGRVNHPELQHPGDLEDGPARHH